MEQNQRERKTIEGKSYIIAKEEDFKQAKEILINVDLAEDEYTLPAESLDLAEAIISNREKFINEFGRADLQTIYKHKFRSFNPIRKRLDPLIEAGLIHVARGAKNGCKYTLDTDFSLMNTGELRENHYAAFSLN